MDTLVHVTTLEMRRRARYGWTVFFISVVKTVIITIALPAGGDTVAAGGTGKLEVGAGLVRVAGLRIFISSVAAIIFAVTLPGEGDTTAVCASHLVSLAGYIGTVGLVREITTVIISIASEVLWNTSVAPTSCTGAGKLVLTASGEGAVLSLV